MARALVIVPTYNERENIVRLISAILEQTPHLDVLVVDDNSPDGTGQLADAMAASSSRVTVLHRAGKLGLGTAYIAGFRHALAGSYDYAIEMDADFSHRPDDLPRLLSMAQEADLVIGSRNVPGGRAVDWSLLRTIISKGGSLYARLLLRLPIRDCTSGFKCFRSTVLAALDLTEVRSNGYAFQVELNHLVHRAGFRIAEIPIIFEDRRIGSSKMSGAIVLEAAAMVWRLRGAQPGRAATAVPSPEAAPLAQAVSSPLLPIVSGKRLGGED